MCGGFFSPPKVESAAPPTETVEEKPDVVYNLKSSDSAAKLRRMQGTKSLQIPLAGTSSSLSSAASGLNTAT